MERRLDRFTVEDDLDARISNSSAFRLLHCFEHLFQKVFNGERLKCHDDATSQVSLRQGLQSLMLEDQADGHPICILWFVLHRVIRRNEWSNATYTLLRSKSRRCRSLCRRCHFCFWHASWLLLQQRWKLIWRCARCSGDGDLWLHANDLVLEVQRRAWSHHSLLPVRQVSHVSCAPWQRVLRILDLIDMLPHWLCLGLNPVEVRTRSKPFIVCFLLAGSAGGDNLWHSVVNLFLLVLGRLWLLLLDGDEILLFLHLHSRLLWSLKKVVSVLIAWLRDSNR